MTDFVIAVEPGGRSVPARAGEPLLKALRRAGLFVDASCGGQGRCGRCAMQVTAGDWSAPDSAEQQAGCRLACRTVPLGDGAVTLLKAGKRPSWWVKFGQAPPEEPLFMAIDIGTTTLSAGIGDVTGSVLLERRTLNPQVAWGADVLHRLAAARDEAESKQLQSVLFDGLRNLVRTTLIGGGVDPSRIEAAAVAGNTAMTVLLLNGDPEPLSTAPFASGLEKYQTLALDPRRFGLAGRTRTFMLPVIGSFVGSDVTAGLIASRFQQGPKPALFLDAGTNGEIVMVARDGYLFAASAAAGPAFEGAHISCGGPAAPGAITAVRACPDGGFDLEILGGGRPRWICGSGLLSLISLLLDQGRLRPDGRLEGGVPVVLDEQSGLQLTQSDIREVQLAVGAIQSGWRILLERTRSKPEDLARLVVTGSFGHALDREAARHIGLLPSGSAEIETVSSGALAGLMAAASGVISQNAWERMARRAVHVPLGGAGFDNVFLESLSLHSFPDR